jgi:hypothetical protein
VLEQEGQFEKGAKVSFSFFPLFLKKCSRPATFCLKLEERERERERKTPVAALLHTGRILSRKKEGSKKRKKNGLAYSEDKNLHLHQPPLQAGSKCFPSLFESIFTN